MIPMPSWVSSTLTAFVGRIATHRFKAVASLR
jgi:hypothetical protein